MDNLPLVVQPLQAEVVSVAVVAGASSDPIAGAGVVETPPNNDSHRDPPVGGRLLQFRRAWVEENCSSSILNIITNGYVLPFHLKTKLTRHPLIISEYKNQQKVRALASCIQSLLTKHVIEKVRKTESLGFYSRLFLVPKPSKVETSHRLKQAKSIPEDRKIQDGDPRINKNILEYRGMGHINRPARRLPPYSNSPKIPKIPAICTQVSDLSVHLSSIRARPSSSSIHHDSKRGKTHGLITGIRIHQYLDDWLIRAQSPEESSHNTKVVVDLTESLGWMINQLKSELIPTQVFSFVGYEYHLNSALVKPTQERWQKLQALILRITNQSALTARHLMSLTGLLASTEKMVPEDRLHIRPFQWHLKENWTFPQSLDKLLPWSDSIIAHLDWWQNPQNVLKGADLHPQEHNVQVFTDASTYV